MTESLCWATERYVSVLEVQLIYIYMTSLVQQSWECFYFFPQTDLFHSGCSVALHPLTYFHFSCCPTSAVALRTPPSKRSYLWILKGVGESLPTVQLTLMGASTVRLHQWGFNHAQLQNNEEHSPDLTITWFCSCGNCCGIIIVQLWY